MKAVSTLKQSMAIVLLLGIVPLMVFPSESYLTGKIKTLDKETQLDTLLSISENYIYTFPDSAIYYAELAMLLEIELFSSTSSHSTRIMADACYYLNDFEKSIEYYGQSAEIEKHTHGELSDDYAARVNDVGYCYYVMGLYDIAITYYQKAFGIFQETGNAEEIYTTLNNIGILYFKWGDFEKAIDYFEQTLEYDTEQGNEDDISTSYNNIGKVYHAWKKYDLAIEHFNRALEYARRTNNTNAQAIRLSNIGMIYYEMGNYSMSLTYLNDALELDKVSGNQYKIAIRKNEISRVLTGHGEFRKAIDYNLEALAFFRNANIKESMAIVYNDLGFCYRSLGEYGESREAYLQCISISDTIGSVYHSMLASKGISELYEERGNTKEALIYFKKYEKLNQQLFNAEKHKQLAQFEIKYETQQKEIENSMLKEENDLKQRGFILVSIVFIGLLIISFLLANSFRMRTKNIRQKQKLTALLLEKKEKEQQHLTDRVFAEQQINRLQEEKYQVTIETKNALLTRSTLDLIRKNEFLISLKTSIQDHADDSEWLNMNLISIINQNIDHDQDWKKFNIEFEQIHPGFFDNLRQAFPDLSEHFIQLCAYLRIGLTTNEIALLQHVSVAAVNKNRQRLRKKLMMEAESDISAYLKSLS